MVVICGENNYKLDTRYVIDGVVCRVRARGEVMVRLVQPRSVPRLTGGVVLIQINFFTIFKICFMFPGNDLHWQFYYVDRQ
jgi:hypothetical protein